MGNYSPYPGVTIAKEPLFEYVPACEEPPSSHYMHSRPTETLLFHFPDETDDDFRSGVMILLEHVDQGSFDMLRQYVPPQDQDSPFEGGLLIEAHCIDVYARRRILSELSHYHPRNVITYNRAHFAESSSRPNRTTMRNRSGVYCSNDNTLSSCNNDNDDEEEQEQAAGPSSSSSSFPTRINVMVPATTNADMEGHIMVMPRTDSYNRYYVLPLYDLPMMAPSMARAEIERQAKISNNVLCDVVFGLMSIGYLYNGTATLIFHQPYPPWSFKLFGKRYSPRAFDDHVYDHYCRVCKQLDGHETHDCPPKYIEYPESDDEEDGDQYMTETSSIV
ncbi:hypothetical protein O0I10_007993 [Lichtheimia ornata]|uniref:Uncharacterized protein n=1 Tax=Lichtheimia ornata TaxID=688661 RepID=A0AAD7V063_9FUNG|nr:uncharacterized protein O0I10_007993 [Lichtheimia ornata]KAJ8656425.1 hypothetical protein O0I10_007993 [Lichtheimia ornata]